MGDKFAYEIVHVNQCPVGVSMLDVQKAQNALRTYFYQEKVQRTQERDAASQGVKNDRKSAKTAYNSAFEMKKDEIRKLNPQLTGNERAEMYKAVRPVVSHQIYDPVVHKYEKAYAASRGDERKVLDGIKKTLKQNNVPFELVSANNRWDISVISDDTDSDDEVLIARLYLGNARFILKDQATAELAAIYVHRNNAREYIQDANDVFIVRYLLRNMSQYDVPANGLTSRNGKVPDNANINQVILKHLRAAEQGESYFISFTTTAREISGSTAGSFYDPAKGQMIVDAARIPKKRIYDVHTLEAISKVIGVGKIEWDTKFGEDDYEPIAAARDTARTREVLIEEKVEEPAIMCIRKGAEPWHDVAGPNVMVKTNQVPPWRFREKDG